MNTLYALLAKMSSKKRAMHLCWLVIFVHVLNGTAIGQTTVNFTSSALTGETLVNPTSLQFGPDNRLYVSQQNGTILAYTIKKNSANSYSVLTTETILSVKNIPNHDDNGTLNTTVTTRQITGILVTGTSANPVLYVSSSDPRIGGGGTAGDKNLDTNSGIISKLTWNGSSWVKVDVVKGLPRSEENHSNNGMALDAATNMLYVAMGGHTNAGSPSNNFAFITEYALSAAILKINLSQIQTQFGGSYTLPTLDDPTRANSGPNGSDVNDPWGGNDGVNQAKLVAGGPVQIHSAGYRNAYDLVITKTAGKAGRMYTIDNGANSGWGGYPDKEGTASVTNKYVVGEPGSTTAGVNDAKVNNLDNLHLVSAPGMTPIYGGHPNPIRANPAGAGIYTFNNTTGVGTFSLTPTADWPPVPVSMANPVESDYRNPGVNDGALYTWGSSTNGIAEYTSTAFNGALAGDLLAASFDGNIYRIKLNTAGTAVSNVSILAGGFGSQPLDVTAQGGNSIFPGTIWAATYGANSITIFEPAGSTNCTGDVSSFSLDDDDDGYSNGDETANGTDPCSAASEPEDFDGDLVSNLRDSDDDNDGLNDMTDKFALDNLNGKSTNMPIDYPFLNGNPGFGLFGMGFTGLMTNNTTDYQSNFDLSKPNLVMGGAVGIASAPAEPGDPTTNNQKYAFQFGVNVTQTTPRFTIQGKLLGSSFFDGASGTQLGTQSQGIYFGTGDQNNYMKLVLHANNANPGFQILIENNGVVTYSNIFPVSNILSASAIDVFFDIDPSNGAVQCKYQTNSAASPVNVGPAITLTGNMLTALQSNNAIAVGLIASAGNKTAFTASWDYLKVISSVTQSLTEVIRINSGGPAVQFGTESWKADQYFSGGTAFTSAIAISNTTNDVLYQSERYGNTTYNIPVPQTGQYTVDLHFAELYFSTAGSRVFNVSVENGQFALQNIDLYKNYGGKAAAAVIKASNVQVSDGFITITLTNVVNNAKISGIAVFRQSGGVPGNRPPVVNKPADISLTSGQSWSYQVSASDPDAGAVLTYSATGLPASLSINASTGLISGSVSASTGTYTVNLTVKDQQNLSASTSFIITVGSLGGLTEVVRINSGGPAVQFGTESWKADQYFSGGTIFNSVIAISNTTNDVLYQSERYGNMTYNIPVPQTGQYTVDLHFAELYFSTAGSRVFNISVENGQFALQNIDLYKNYGGKAAAAVIKASNVQVSDGFITIALTNVVNNAKISGIAVFRQTGGTTNQAPVANAGPNKTITLPTSSVVLSGSGSDPEDGTNVTYSWSQVSGPSTAAFSSTTQPSPTVSNLIAGTYVFGLIVKDSKLLSSPSDQVSVIVNPATGSNQQLVSFSLINASNEQEIQTLTSSTTLNLATLPSQSLNIRANTSPSTVGSVVFALSGTQTRNFTESGAPYALFGDVNGNYNGWTPAVGSYTLKGTPYSGASGGGTAGTSLTISFTVINQANRPPVVTKPANISLNVGQSWSYQVQASDPDPGSILTYSATNLPASLSIDANTGLISGSVTSVEGTYTVNLSVKDQQNLSASTSFVITVINSGSTNQAPVANAGPNKTITLPISSVVLSGSGSDPEDGTNVTYSWSQVSGPSSAAFSSTTQASPTVSNLIAGTYVFGLIVKDSKLLSSPSDQVSVIVNPATGGTQQLVGFTLINATNEQEIQTLSSNTTLNLATLPSQSLNIRANTSPLTVGSVVFALSGTQTHNQTETGAPYALFGDVNGNYNAWTPAVGSYTLKGTPYSAAGGGGTAGTPLTINFTVINQANQPPVITKPANANVITGQIFNYQIMANDPEGTALSYSASNLPASLNINASTGLISGTVTGAAGVYTISVTVKDQPGLTASTSFTITVSNPNQPPVVTRPQNMSVIAGQNFSYQVIASDPEGTALEYKATNLPVGLTINAVSGLISGIINDQAANYDVTLEVQDQQGLTASTEFVITVMNANQPPVVSQPDSLTAVQNNSFSYQVEANDPEDGKTGLVYAANGLPAGLGIDAETGLISGIVTATVGDYAILLNVQDKEGLSGIGKTFTITVSTANEAPVITQPIDQVATLNDNFSYQVEASDPEDGQVGLVYSSNGLPASLTLNSTSGLISGIITASPGNYTVTLGIKDKNGLSGVEKSFTIRISNPNQQPVITSPGNLIISRNTTFSYQVQASDPEDGQNGLQYSSSELPAGLSLNPTTGLISGTATAAVGDYDITLNVSDKKGLAAISATFVMSLIDNQAPTIIKPADVALSLGDTWSYQVLASDADNNSLTYTATNLPPSLTISSNGLISGTITAPGIYSVSLTVVDEHTASASTNFVITIAETLLMSTKSLPLNESNTFISDISNFETRVFPNPAHDEFSVTFFNKNRSKWNFTLYNIYGHVSRLAQQSFEKGINTVSFNLTSHNLIPGVYFLIMTNNLSEKKSIKVIIN